MLRDRLTFAMAVGIPILQLVLFGYAINTDPKGLPTAMVGADTAMRRSLAAALQNSSYFRITPPTSASARPTSWLLRGELQFVVQIPDDFAAACVRGEQPAILVTADATDPRRAATPSRRSSASPPRRWPRPRPGVGRGGRGRAALRAGRAPALQPPRACRATTSCPGWWAPSHHDHGDALSLAMTRGASAARWKTCSPRRRVRSR